MGLAHVGPGPGGHLCGLEGYGVQIQESGCIKLIPFSCLISLDPIDLCTPNAEVEALKFNRRKGVESLPPQKRYDMCQESNSLMGTLSWAGMIRAVEGCFVLPSA